jgi:nucleotide-binding universal stress UspA family protein
VAARATHGAHRHGFSLKSIVSLRNEVNLLARTDPHPLARLRERHGGAWIAMCVHVESPRHVSFMANPTNLGVDRILCAVTFSPSARHVVESAASLAEAYGAELRLFHILRSTEGVSAAATDTDSERTLAKLFALARHVPGRPRISAAVTSGDAADEILRHARMVQADLIAIGMHAGDQTVSPVVEKVAIHAPCPVLVVPRPDDRPSRPRRAPHAVLCGVDFSPASLASASHAYRLAHGLGARVTFVHVLPERWEGPQRQDANLGAWRHALEHRFRSLLQDTISEVSGLGDSSPVVVSGSPCVEIVRLARTGGADLVVMGIDAQQRSRNELGSTTSCVMHLAQTPVLLVPEHLFDMPQVTRATLSDGRH